MSNFTEAHVVICGGTSGIGLECAQKFLHEGAHVTCVGKTSTHASEAQDALSAFEKAKVVQVDLTSEKEVSDFFRDYGKENTKIDVLVNSAGTISSGGIGKETVEDWDRVIAGNLRSVFLTMNAALTLLKNSSGAAVVNVSSVCSLTPCTSMSYSVSKAGLDMMTKCLAKDLANQNIRVNAVNPGVVESNLQKSAGLFADEEDYQSWISKMQVMHPLGRAGVPTDVAAAIMFLASSHASWITGATLSVDGGRAIA